MKNKNQMCVSISIWFRNQILCYTNYNNKSFTDSMWIPNIMAISAYV